ncbi:MAG: hypothetical protein QXR34_10135 [Saccharolobus sp.]
MFITTLTNAEIKNLTIFIPHVEALDVVILLDVVVAVLVVIT